MTMTLEDMFYDEDTYKFDMFLLKEEIRCATEKYMRGGEIYVEGIGETIGRVVQAIKDFITNLINKIRNFFKRLFKIKDKKPNKIVNNKEADREPDKTITPKSFHSNDKFIQSKQKDEDKKYSYWLVSNDAINFYDEVFEQIVVVLGRHKLDNTSKINYKFENQIIPNTFDMQKFFCSNEEYFQKYLNKDEELIKDIENKLAKLYIAVDFIKEATFSNSLQSKIIKDVSTLIKVFNKMMSSVEKNASFYEENLKLGNE
jgi:hypothetical protein